MKITLENLAEATAQKVFSQAKIHLLNQMEKSVNKDGDYIYYLVRKGLKTLKCAAGCFISEEEFAKMSPSSNSLTCWRSIVINGRYSLNNCNLIEDLQFIHDENEPCEWEGKLKELAVKYKLEF